MKTIPTILAGVLIVVSAAPHERVVWGEHGHRVVGQLAAEVVPAEMPAFFREAAARLSYLNYEPDRWRDEKEQLLEPAMNLAYAYDHYVNFEFVPEGALRARNRFAYLDSVRAAGNRTPNVGLLPFALVEMTQKLRVDFREWRKATNPQERAWIEQRIIDDAGVLGHFAADGANPHHTTKHQDGWVGDNPKGYTKGPFFHGRFESQYVGAQLTAADARQFVKAPPRVIPDVREGVLTYLRASHALVPRLYDLDRIEPFGRDNRNPEHKRFTAERLAVGAEMLRDLWWTAWVTSQ